MHHAAHHHVFTPTTTPQVSHPWIVREVASGARMMLRGAATVVGMAQEQTVDIADPPELAWGVSGARARWWRGAGPT